MESESALDIGDKWHAFATEQSRFPLNNTRNNKFHKINIVKITNWSTNTS